MPIGGEADTSFGAGKAENLARLTGRCPSCEGPHALAPTQHLEAPAESADRRGRGEPCGRTESDTISGTGERGSHILPSLAGGLPGYCDVTSGYSTPTAWRAKKRRATRCTSCAVTFPNRESNSVTSGPGSPIATARAIIKQRFPRPS